MLVGVGIDPGLGLTRDQQRDLVRESARLGYDSLWTPTGAGARSAFLTCADWWQTSSEVTPGGLGTGVSVVPLGAWTMPTLAAQAASVADFTGGKFKLGIGIGSVQQHTISVTRDALTTLNALFDGESVDGVRLAFKAPKPPIYLAAMGPQMLRLSAKLADGVTPNWSSAEEIGKLRQAVADGDPRGASLPFAQYIRVCIDDDEDAARRAFMQNMLQYALARPGQPKDRGYRGHFARMGFDAVLNDLEERRAAGVAVAELAELVPAELALKVGYFGKPAGAAEALRVLSQGLDEAMMRLITTASGSLEKALLAVKACAPSGWRRDG